MKGLERIGLLKMDFLGLTTLTVLDDTVKMVAQNRGVTIDLDNAAARRRSHLQAFRARRHDGHLPI